MFRKCRGASTCVRLREFMKVGDEVEAVILTLDREGAQDVARHQAAYARSLGEYRDQVSRRGAKTTAKVRNFTNFGVFVEIEEGIDGLIHISDLSWTKKVKHPGEFTSVGADIEVVVLEIDKENRRLSLGHKQLEENPWNEFENQYSVDSIHEGTVTEMTDKGAVVALGENIEGFCPASARQRGRHDSEGGRQAQLQGHRVLEGHQAHHPFAPAYLRGGEACRNRCREG